jgi:hypothetical protein
LFFRGSGAERLRHGGIVRLAPYYLLLGAYFVIRKAITGHLVGQYGPTGTEMFAPALMPKGIAHLLAFHLRPTGGPLLTPEAYLLVGQTLRVLIDPVAWTVALAIIALIITVRPDRRAWFCLTLMMVLALPLLSILAEKQLPIEAARLHYLPSVAFCLFLSALLANARPLIGRSLGAIIFLSFAALAAVNSLPWIGAAGIVRQSIGTIERAAGRPGADQVIILGNPDFYFGAELFGARSWALHVAAAAPFAKIPATTRITHIPDESCDRSLAGILEERRRPIVLRWERDQRRLSETTVDRLQEICRRPLSRVPGPPHVESHSPSSQPSPPRGEKATLRTPPLLSPNGGEERYWRREPGEERSSPI